MEEVTLSSKKLQHRNKSQLTGAAGVALTTCGGIPEAGTVPLGGRFLLVTDAQENDCGGRKHTLNDPSNRKSAR